MDLRKERLVGHKGGTQARPAEDTACAKWGRGRWVVHPKPRLCYGTIAREMASDTGTENLS